MKTIFWILLEISILTSCTNPGKVSEQINKEATDSTEIGAEDSDLTVQPNTEVLLNYEPFPELFEATADYATLTQLLKDMDYLLKDNGVNLRSQDNILKYIHSLILLCHTINNDYTFSFFEHEKYYSSLKKIGIIPEEHEGGFLQFKYEYDFLKPFIDKYVAKESIYAKVDSLCNIITMPFDSVVHVKPYLDYIALIQTIQILGMDEHENCLSWKDYLEMVANITDIYKYGENYYIRGLNTFLKYKIDNFNDYVNFCEENRNLVYASYLDSIITNISEISPQDSVVYVVSGNYTSQNDRFDHYNVFNWFSQALPHRIDNMQGTENTIMGLRFYSDSTKAYNVFKNTSIYQKSIVKINLKVYFKQ